MIEIEAYIEAMSSPEPDVLRELVRQTHLRVLRAQMLSGHLQGRLLAILTSMFAPKRVLELGTFTGYSTICIAQSMTGGELHTVDSNDELQAMAASFFTKAGVADIVVPHIGLALDVMTSFDEPFDMVYLDANKREYCDYYNALFELNLVHRGSVILADNTLWYGKVVGDVAANDKQAMGIRQFNELVAADDRVEQVILPLRDGVTIIRVK